MCSVMWEAILYKGVCSGQPSGFLYYNLIIRIKMPPTPKNQHMGDLYVSLWVWTTRTPQKTGRLNLGASEFWRVNSSCSTNGTRRVTLVTNTVDIVNMNEKRATIIFAFNCQIEFISSGNFHITCNKCRISFVNK